MDRAALKVLVGSLENECFRLSLAIIDRPEDTDTLGEELQRKLDEAQYRLDALRDTARRVANDARGAFREIAGRAFNAETNGRQHLCTDCGRYWAPATETLCARCAELRKEF